MKINNRLNSIEEYHFKDLGSIKEKAKLDGKEIIDLSIGDPDLPVHPSIIRGFIDGLNEVEFNKYPPYDGLKELKLEVIKYYREVFSVNLNLEQVIILIGSKEGINNIIPAVCDIGDIVITPHPSYPVYRTSSKLWGCKTYDVFLKMKNNYMPVLEEIPLAIARKAKLFFINYPNNPTGAVADEMFYKHLISFCEKYDIVLCNDAAYNEIIVPNKRPISLLQFDNKINCIEFGSMSKTYNMTGFRIGYAVGNSKVIKSLLKIKSNVDSGQFIPIQKAAINALKLDRMYIDTMRKIYYERKEAVYGILNKHNIKYFKGEGTFYIWCTTPKNYTTSEFCKELLKDYGIIITPGHIFGNMCYNNFRIALTSTREYICNMLSQIGYYN